MFTLLAAVIQDFFIVATSVLKGICQDRHSVEGLLLVNASGQGEDGGGKPGGVEDYGAEGKGTEQLPKKIGLNRRFILLVAA